MIYRVFVKDQDVLLHFKDFQEILSHQFHFPNSLPLLFSIN
jgi:hypothetical protein